MEAGEAFFYEDAKPVHAEHVWEETAAK